MPHAVKTPTIHGIAAAFISSVGGISVAIRPPDNGAFDWNSLSFSSNVELSFAVEADMRSLLPPAVGMNAKHPVSTGWGGFPSREPIHRGISDNSRKSPFALMECPEPHVHPHAARTEFRQQPLIALSKAALSPTARAAFFVISETRFVPGPATPHVYATLEPFYCVLKRLTFLKNYANPHASASLRLTRDRISKKTRAIKSR
jgi:hypothetical protein